jgi:hypothetical protein
VYAEVPAQAAAVDLGPLADALLADTGAAYSAAEKAVVFCNHWDQEGMGSGIAAIFVPRTGKRSELGMLEPTDDEPGETLAASRSKLLERLRQGAFVALSPTPWTGKSALRTRGGWVLTWRGRQLWGVPPGQKPQLLATIRAEKFWKMAPTSVFTAPDQPVLVVAVYRDPGPRYLEGYNQFTSHEVVWLPEMPTTTSK